MLKTFSTARERRSTFIFACPTPETIRLLRDYAIQNKIPNAAGFRPNPLFHLTLLRNAQPFKFPWCDIQHYHRPIVVNTKGRAPDIFTPHHKAFSTIGIHAPAEFFFKRHSYLHQFVGMRADSQFRPHLMLSYWAPVQSWRLPPFDFDMEFDHERITDLMAWVRPREVHEEIYREKRELAHVRGRDIRRGR